MQGYETIIIEDLGPIRILTLNQPEIFNPLDDVSGTELTKALEQADRNSEIRVIVLTGAGKAFSAGGNVRLMAQGLEKKLQPSKFFAEVAALLNRSIIALRRISKPVICAMNGVASGAGLGWALACDMIVASEYALLDPGYIRIAVSPDGGNSALVTRLIGLKRATEFFMLGKSISAEKALEWGMVNRVVKQDQVLEQAILLAKELAQGPKEALALTKKLLNEATLGDLESILEEERQTIMHLSDQPDFAEGIKAFFEKRKPNFK